MTISNFAKSSPNLSESELSNTDTGELVAVVTRNVPLANDEQNLINIATLC